MNKTVRLYTNSTKQTANLLSEEIKQELISNGYKIVDKDAKYTIALGGDGTLLNLLRENNYSLSSKYIGVNCGTLGFLQDFNPCNVKDFVSNIENYDEKLIKILEIDITNKGTKQTFYCLNEFVIKECLDKSLRAKVYILDKFLEDYVGSGIVFATTVGSTALNLSCGGTIISPEINTIQITPKEPIASSKIHCLAKSICLPENYNITIYPKYTQKITILSDIEAVYSGEYDSIRISYSDKYLKKLVPKDSNFITTISEKLI